MAWEAALKEVANRKLRRLLACNKSSNCADFKIGDSVLFYKTPDRKRTRKWRGTACISDIDETGETARYRSQTFKVARYCLRGRVDEKELGEVKISADQRRTSVFEPEWESPSLGWTPKATDGPAAEAEAVAMGRERIAGSVPQDAPGAVGRPPND